MGALLSEPISAIVVERAVSGPYDTATATVQGWRRSHEDAHILQLWPDAVAPPCGAFAVLDGHGGHACARMASTLLQDQLQTIVCRKTPIPSSALESEIKKVFFDVDGVLRASLPASDGSGSTIVAAVVEMVGRNEYRVCLAHAGDSRAVVRTGVRRGDVRLVCTDDHKPGRDDEKERIVAAGGSVEHGPLGGGPLRVDGALAVSRSFGDFRFKPTTTPVEKCKVTALAEVQVIERCHAGDWILLACDGIFDVMENEEVDEFVSSRLANPGQQNPETIGSTIAVDLLNHCLEKGSKDNCTACLVQVGDAESVSGNVVRSRELLQGRWRTAPSDIQTKYADFFESEGFETEAKAVRHAVDTGPPPAPALASDGRSLSGQATSAPNQRMQELQKAIQAIRGSRAIQTAWRASRGSVRGQTNSGQSPRPEDSGSSARGSTC